MVNVVGTLNVFEAARACGIGRVSYASSAAVYGPDDCGAGGEGTPPTEATPCTPGSHYGVYKVANEGNDLAHAVYNYNSDGRAYTGSCRAINVTRLEPVGSYERRKVMSAAGQEWTLGHLKWPQ